MAYDFFSSLNAHPYEVMLKNVILKDIDTEQGGIILDLVDVIAAIYCCDITIARQIDHRRRFNICVPVTNPEMWGETKTILQELLSFVSKDDLSVNFIKEDKKLLIDRLSLNFPGFHNVSLLSGGLDSFCGAHQNIESGFKSIYCGYKINKFEQSKQTAIRNFVAAKHSDSLSYFFEKLNLEKIEPTQATRSLLFLALACAVAYTNDVKVIHIYENGVLSLNPVKNGRFTTKTTHPKTIKLFNELLSILKIDLKVSNPFQYKTKGEIINKLDEGFKAAIVNTHTCSLSRQNPHIFEKKKQCGFCIPCILRKISLASYDNEQFDVEYEVNYGAKLTDVTDAYQKVEYKSSLEYFKAYKQDIDNKTIYQTLGLKEMYYEDRDFLQKTDEMLSLFSQEVERYLVKYDIY
ncbi:7-cyano-7-deazaguanine synthase [Paenibacillus antibioticophila]|uniref:7-cyano-7-deazaguanine synthase n=1 Tax=Paenibacillus antibioticophila TaxID=1274374 RepID=UPI001305247F|nr:7-cyano-7-deazaguanine synthase [Paenibacillus antibioticophila]